MGFFDSLFGRKDDNQNYAESSYGRETYGRTDVARTGMGRADVGRTVTRPENADEQALARYRYMLQTAPPEEIERAHEEAFAKLTPEQRKLALEQMSQQLPEAEARNLSDDPRSLARAATRAEIRQPGAVGSMFGGGGNMGGGMMGGGMMGGGMMGGMSGMLAGSLLTSLAGGFIGSSIAHSFFSNPGNEQAFQGSPEAAAVDGGVSDFGDANYQETGLDSSADPYGDPMEGQQADTGDSGGFSDVSDDFGGFDGGDFGGDF